MKNKIQAFLSQIEKEKNIQILYANESGSRAWGFPSPDSDYDIRFIYRRERDWYLSVNEGKDQMTVMPNKLLDGSGWDFRKYLRLLHSSNATCFDWLNSPIIYREEKLFSEPVRELTKKYFQPKKVMFHFLGIAKGMLQREFLTDRVRIKKYFYVLRPVLTAVYIAKHKKAAPVDFHELLPLVKSNESVYQEITDLLKQKEKAMEGDLVKRVKILDEFVAQEMARCEAIARSLPKQQMSWNDINLFYRKILDI
ncbi:MAG: nucleotidyltransferase domain-containing protein [Bacteroidota bacterium]